VVAGWTLAAWVQVTLPGLYWQHYYLLPTPGVAIAIAVCSSDAASILFGALRRGDGAPTVRRPGAARSLRRRFLLAAGSMVVLSAACAATLLIQARDYLLVAPTELTRRYKGGGQWIFLRAMGRELARRAAGWDRAELYVWGWQSPLYFYSRLESPSRHFFVDNLLRDQADRGHPLIQPRIDEIMSVLKRRPPELVFTGYPPFRALRALLGAAYLPSRWPPGYWIRRDAFGPFEMTGVHDLSAWFKDPRGPP
jgi:hypothetical protein